MADVARIQADYRRAFARVGEDILIRRYTGPAGQNRAKVEASAKAKPSGGDDQEIAGSVTQKESKFIVFNDPLAEIPAGMVSLASMLPLSVSDKIVLNGTKEISILDVDDKSRRVAGTVIALVVTALG